MINFEVNTQKLRECGQDINRLQAEYVELIHQLYQRIYQVPTITEEWIGESATKYANYAILEKEQYLVYGDSIRKAANTLINYADQLENVVRKTKGIH